MVPTNDDGMIKGVVPSRKQLELAGTLHFRIQRLCQMQHVKIISQSLKSVAAPEDLCSALEKGFFIDDR